MTPPAPSNPTTPPTPPKPPTPPTPPTREATESQEQAFNERAQPEVPVASEEGQTDTAEAAHPATVNPEQEREAILRMIAEGRITPEEGDMLLEALFQYPESGS